jgi:PII-like signaling protein
MKGIYLIFYVHENRKHHHKLAYEWLLAQAKKLGIHGGSAFRSIAGFGRHGVVHEDHFFELQGDLPVEVTFAVSDEEAQKLLDLVRAEKLSLFYVKLPIEFGTIDGGDGGETQP